MTILKRLSRLVKADVHGLLDAIEDPNATLHQALRDMKEHIQKEERALHELVALRDEAHRKVEERERIAIEHQEQITLCLNNGNDTLARSVIKKKLEGAPILMMLKKRAHSLVQEIATREAALRTKREKLREMEEKGALFFTIQGENRDDERGDSRQSASTTVNEAEIEVALLAEKERLGLQKNSL